MHARNRQAHKSAQLDMFAELLPSGANPTGVFRRKINLLRQQQTKRIGLTLADAVARSGPSQGRAYRRC